MVADTQGNSLVRVMLLRVSPAVWNARPRGFYCTRCVCLYFGNKSLKNRGASGACYEGVVTIRYPSAR